MKPKLDRKLKVKEAEIIRLTDEFLRRAALGRTMVERKWFTSIMFDRGNQWLHFSPEHDRFRRTGSKKKIPRPVTNKYKSTKNALVSALLSFDPRLVYAPQTNNPDDMHSSQVATNIIKALEFEWSWERKKAEALPWLVLTGGVFLVGAFDEHAGAMEERTVQECIGVSSGVCNYITTGDEDECPRCAEQGINSPIVPIVDPETGQPEVTLVPQGQMTLDIVSPFEMFVDMTVPDMQEQEMIIRVHRKTKQWLASKLGLTQKQIDELPDASIGGGPTGDALRYRTALAHFVQLSEVHYKDKVDIIEIWQKPTVTWPLGFHAIRIGIKMLHLEPYPYRTPEGRIFSNIVYIPYERETGSFYGTTPMFSLIEKQRTRNRLEALVLMSAMRMANPVWIIPEPGTRMALTGDVGLVVKYTPGAQGAQPPRRDEGIPVPPSIVTLIQLIDQDFDLLVGLSEITKGQRPLSARTSSAYEKLEEVARSRQSGLFHNWTLGLSDLQLMGLELFRMVQPEARYSRMTGSGTGSWTVRKIEAADLAGGVDIAPEAGGAHPRTAVERQAMMSLLLQQGLINVQDPKVLLAFYRLYGLSELAPEIDKNMMQIAREHDRFRQTKQIQLFPWDNHEMHSQEHQNFMLSEEFEELPQEEQQVFMEHKAQHDQIVQQQQAQALQQQLALIQAQKGGVSAP